MQGETTEGWTEPEHGAAYGSMNTMRETFHLVLSVATLGVFLLAIVSAPRVGRAAGDAGSFAVLQTTPYQRRQQLLSTVEDMYGRETGSQKAYVSHVQQRQQLLSTVSEIDRALGDSEDAVNENSQSIGRVQATGEIFV